MRRRGSCFSHYDLRILLSRDNAPEWLSLNPESLNGCSATLPPRRLPERLLSCSPRFASLWALTLTTFTMIDWYQNLTLINTIPLRNILSTSTPQCLVIGSIWVSMSFAIYYRFSNSYWKVNCATVFLIIPPAIFVTDCTRLFILKCAKCGFSMW